MVRLCLHLLIVIILPVRVLRLRVILTKEVASHHRVIEESLVVVCLSLEARLATIAFGMVLVCHGEGLFAVGAF